MAIVRISVVPMVNWKCLIPCGADLDVRILFLTEYSNMALLAANIIQKTIMTAVFL